MPGTARWSIRNPTCATFFDQDAETLAGDGYDISKLVQLLDALIAEVSCLTGADPE